MRGLARDFIIAHDRRGVTTTQVPIQSGHDAKTLSE